MHTPGNWVRSRRDGRYAFVSWWPPLRRLHYAELCCGIYDFLRRPPDAYYLTRAREYLAALERHPMVPMQLDRIAWTRLWIEQAIVMENISEYILPL